MFKKKYRISALFLAVVLIATSLDLTSFATDCTATENTETEYTEVNGTEEMMTESVPSTELDTEEETETEVETEAETEAETEDETEDEIDTEEETEQVDCVTEFIAEAKSYNSVLLSWDEVDEADSYEIFRSTSEDTGYTSLVMVQDGTVTSYTDNSVKTGTTYYYEIRVWEEGEYSVFSDIASAKTSLKKAQISKAVSAGISSIKLTWKKVTGASGYQLYRAAKQSGDYEKIATLTGTGKLKYTDTGRKLGKTYYYKVRAYILVNNKKVYGAFSSATGVKVVLTSPEVTKASKIKSTGVKITWGAVADASGYEVYCSNKKKSGYTKVKTLKDAGKVTYTNSKLKKKKTYYYKVRAYVVVKGKKVYSSYSSVKAVKL